MMSNAMEGQITSSDRPERGMDAGDQYARFRQLAAPLVAARQQTDPEFLKEDWVVLCYNSQQTFETHFPDRTECEEALRWLAIRVEEIRERVATEIDRLRSGLGYLNQERVLREDKGDEPGAPPRVA